MILECGGGECAKKMDDDDDDALRGWFLVIELDFNVRISRHLIF